jgi:hypothetical protein
MHGDAAHPSASGMTLLDRAALSRNVLRAGGWLLRATGYTLFFLMLFLPTAYQPIKGALLGLTVVGIVMAAAVTGRFPLAPGIALGALGYSALGLASVIKGLTGGAPGALAMFNVYVMWPLVYTLLVVGASFPGVLRGLTRVTVCAALAISLYSIIFVLREAGYWPSALYYAFDQGQAIGFHGTYVEFGLYSTTTLLFLVPYLVGALFVFPKAHAPVSRPMLWLTMVLSFTTVLLSGRRALLLLVPLAPVLALLFRAWLSVTRKRESRRLVRRVGWAALAMALVLIVIMTAIGGMAPAGFVDMVASGFRFNSDVVAMSRRDQFLALVNGWLQQPLFGSGHGAPVRDVIRSPEVPWAYELTYLALLYHTGIVGFLAYSAGLFWTFLKSRQIARTGWPQAPYLVATLVGTASFVLANATNPYLEKYDSIWVLFLPIAFINAYLMETHRARA